METKLNFKMRKAIKTVLVKREYMVQRSAANISK